MCATKLHGAKRDGPVVRGQLFFADNNSPLPVPPEGLVCATKLHGAKFDGPAVAGLSFFAIRWRNNLYPETNIKVQVRFV